jgi:hypothetical protein
MGPPVPIFSLHLNIHSQLKSQRPSKKGVYIAMSARTLHFMDNLSTLGQVNMFLPENNQIFGLNTPFTNTK